MGMQCGNMEVAGLLIYADCPGVNALCILTVSDHMLKDDHATTE
ncbi:hypothetical protein [Lysinibacillus sp. NPDC059133]